MRFYTVGESILKGLRIQRDKTGPCLAQSAYSAVVVTLGEDTVRFINAKAPGGIEPIAEGIVVLDKVQGLTTIQLEGYRPAAEVEDEEEQALVYLEIMAGVGGRVALLPPALEIANGVAKKYCSFPPQGVQFLGSDADAAAAHGGLHPSMDAWVLLKPGGCIRIERTGGLKDQHGDSAPSIFTIRWNGRIKELSMTAEEGKVRPSTWPSVAAQTARTARRRKQQWAKAQAWAS